VHDSLKTSIKTLLLTSMLSFHTFIPPSKRTRIANCAPSLLDLLEISPVQWGHKRQTTPMPS
jgi:hypothetical protein